MIRKQKVIEFDEYNAFTGMDKAAKLPTGLTLQGKITKILYNKPQERSILEVFLNYKQAIEKSGAEILYSCNQAKQQCAKKYAGPTMQKYSGIQSVSNLNGSYLLARIEQENKIAYIAIAVGQSFTDVHVVEVQKMDTNMVGLDADALAKGLDVNGYVIVEGIFFDTDKATLKPKSASSLKEINKLMKQRPSLKIYVVGHTDMQGSLSYNRNLSDRRARAVVSKLINNYGIDASRMEGYGVGPLSPQATNKNDGGRAKNRRVVLVAQ